VLIEWVAAKSIFSRSVNRPIFREMGQHANPDFSVPLYNALKHHIKCLAELDQQLPERQEKRYCSWMIDEAKNSADLF
jgi:hypothetical protein